MFDEILVDDEISVVSFDASKDATEDSLFLSEDITMSPTFATSESTFTLSNGLVSITKDPGDAKRVNIN